MARTAQNRYVVVFEDHEGWSREVLVWAMNKGAAIRKVRRGSGGRGFEAIPVDPRTGRPKHRRSAGKRKHNPAQSNTFKTLGYTLLVAGLTAGVGAVVIYFVNKKLEPPPKEDALDIKIGGTAADQAKAAADKAAADLKAWINRGGTWGATPETGNA